MSQGEDADTKKHLQEIKDASATLHKTVSVCLFLILCSIWVYSDDRLVFSPRAWI